MARVALFVIAMLLAGCATCTVQPNGTITGRAFGNAACSVCSPGARLAAADPVPPPIVPVVHPGCVVIQGGAETGNTITTVLGIIGAFLAGMAL